jgi:hypothetical protein
MEIAKFPIYRLENRSEVEIDEDGYNVSNVMFYLHQNSVGLPLGWDGIEGFRSSCWNLIGKISSI